MAKSWYSIKAAAENETEISIYDEIGYYGISAKQFLDDFKKIPDENTIAVRINSPGGDFFDGLAMFNILVRHKGAVNVYIDGIAASAASLIAMAGNKVIMPENTFLMIHNTSGVVIGNADDMVEFADILSKLDDALIKTYKRKSGQEEKTIAKLMDAETWLNAREAKDLGFADEVTAAIKIAASLNLSKFKNLPAGLEHLQPRSTADERPPPPPVETQPDAVRREIVAVVELCSNAGVPEAATQFLSDGLNLEQVKTKLGAADKIRALCAAAHLPDRANGYIKAGLTEDEARKDLWLVVLNRDQAGEINNKIGPEAERSEAQPKKTATSAEIYAMRAKRLQLVKKA